MRWRPIYLSKPALRAPKVIIVSSSRVITTLANGMASSAAAWRMRISMKRLAMACGGNGRAHQPEARNSHRYNAVARMLRRWANRLAACSKPKSALLKLALLRAASWRGGVLRYHVLQYEQACAFRRHAFQSKRGQLSPLYRARIA